MQLYGTIILRDLVTRHAECRALLAAWQYEVEEATWASARQLQERYVNSQVSKGGAVVFQLLRGLYWLATKVKFDRGIVIVEQAWADSESPQAAAPKTSK